MKREEAIEKLSKKKLLELSLEDRSEQLEIMTFEDWSESDKWNCLPQEVRQEIEEGELPADPIDAKYDDVLMIWLRNSLQAVSNDFLKSELGIPSIEGEPLLLESCPCCGCRTIGERGGYDICEVCWWEDDGQDNDFSDEVFGGPNYGISLTQGRVNFIKHGIYDPERTDLAASKAHSSKYQKGRFFEIHGNYIHEKGTIWKAKIENIS